MLLGGVCDSSGDWAMSLHFAEVTINTQGSAQMLLSFAHDRQRRTTDAGPPTLSTSDHSCAPVADTHHTLHYENKKG